MNRRTKLSSTGAAVALLFTVAALFSPGCSYSPGDYCRDACDCVGCSDAELDGCIDDAEDLFDQADKAGCGDKANAYLSCLGSEGECRDGFYDADGCEKESTDAQKCLVGSEGEDSD